MSLQLLRGRELKPPSRPAAPSRMVAGDNPRRPSPTSQNRRCPEGQAGSALSRGRRDARLLSPLLSRHLAGGVERLALAVPRPHPHARGARAHLPSVGRRGERGRPHEGALPVGITPYYASLMGLDDPTEPLRRTHIMTGDEYVRVPGEADDPLGEDHDTVVPGLVHRYPDRVLFLTTGTCSTYCRYCTRSRLVGNPGGEYQFSTRQWEKALGLSRAHTEVRDVLLSGGDPLSIGDDKLDWLLTPAARHQAHRVPAHRHEDPGGAAAAHHQEPGEDAEEASSAVDEHPFHPSARADARGDRSAGAAGGCRHSARQPDRAAQGHQRRHPS
jgi:hypothetical protein